MKVETTNFEFGSAFAINSREYLEKYLCIIWYEHQRYLNPIAITDELKVSQGFLSFDGNTARAKNYIGFIQGDGNHIEIYPKVFKNHDISKFAILKHIFYWLDYCRKWKFPFSSVNLTNLEDIELPELIINLIADQIYHVISAFPLSLYEDVEEGLLIPKGTIDFNRYITNSLSNGNFHMLECNYKPLLYDNTLNKVIKYVTRLLMSKAKYSETFNRLQKIIFVLDDVEDCFCTSDILQGVQLNSYFSEYNVVIDLCKMVLEGFVYNHAISSQSHWSLLLPMEYVFEDFIAGFLETHFSKEWTVRYQKSDMYLTDQKVFQMQHDIFLISRENPKLEIIIDTKYKLRGDYKIDPKRGISQSDLYQMTSYAFRRGCSNILLLYPNESDICLDYDRFTISNFGKSQKINVICSEVPFWSKLGNNILELHLKERLTSLISLYQYE